MSLSQLPTLVISKILIMLDSDSILNLSNVCKHFYSLIHHDYLMGLTIPVEDHVIYNEIKRKNVLRLKLNIMVTGSHTTTFGNQNIPMC